MWKNLGEEEYREQNNDGKDWETYFSNLYKKHYELDEDIPEDRWIRWRYTRKHCELDEDIPENTMN